MRVAPSGDSWREGRARSFPQPWGLAGSVLPDTGWGGSPLGCGVQGLRKGPRSAQGNHLQLYTAALGALVKHLASGVWAG